MPEVRDAIEEVVNGEIRIMPPPKLIHAEIVENLADLLRRQLDPKTVRVRVSAFGVVIRCDPVTTRVPDLAVFRKASMVEKDGYVHSAPELVVECFRPATRGASARRRSGTARASAFRKCGWYPTKPARLKSCC